MVTIVTRSGKGSALTHAEMDANFNNLNNGIKDPNYTWTANQNGFQTVTGIPSTARELVIQANNLRQSSSNTYDYFFLRLGDSGGVESSGYFYYRQSAVGTSYSGAGAEGTSTSGTSSWPIIFSIPWSAAFTLQWYLSSSDGITWYMSGTSGCMNTSSTYLRFQSIAGRKTLSSTLDRVQVYQNNPSWGYGGGFWRVGYR